MRAALFRLLSRLPILGFRAARAWEHLRSSHAETHALLENPALQPFEAVPDVSGWSIAQHAFHAAAINRAILPWVRAQCDGAGAPDAGAPNAAGFLVLLTGRIPRGRSQTPARFAPPAQPDRAALDALLAANEKTLRALAPCLPRLHALRGCRRHPRLGVLDARAWLRFAAVHTRHHQRIMRAVAEAQAAP